MTRDGNNQESMQNKIKYHSNLIFLVKTNEYITFGGYTSCRIDYSDGFKDAQKSFLFSEDLNKKFEVKKNGNNAIDDDYTHGIYFGDMNLVLFACDDNIICHSCVGDECSRYEMNETTKDEFCGGINI